MKYDMENYANRTQGFVNECVERLIDDLSNEGYNLIIEGTLRNPDVPINTCRTLTEKGYTADMYVIAVDATVSWKSTISRAKILLDLGNAPRLVPIDKYDQIVNALPDNIRKIESCGYFHSFHVIDRDYNTLYPNNRSKSASTTLCEVLNLENWNRNYEQRADEFLEAKIEILKMQQDVVRNLKRR